ncbi:hypothetical protein J4427_01565 [Candidatus Woesearchaeota archaeon]|nr:hypothetical protein [Candidatus Woesearchaeota archaeon]
MPEKELSTLRNVLEEISKELRGIEKLKDTYEKTAYKEIRLRNKITSLIKKEAKLSEQREKLRKEIASARLGRVKNIKEELKSI